MSKAATLASTRSRCWEAVLPARGSSPGRHVELQQHEPRRTASRHCPGMGRNTRAVNEAPGEMLSGALAESSSPAASRFPCSGEEAFWEKPLCLLRSSPRSPRAAWPHGGEALLNRLFHKHSPEEAKPSEVNETGSPELHKMLALARTLQNI